MTKIERIYHTEPQREKSVCIEKSDVEYMIGKDLCFRKLPPMDKIDPTELGKKYKKAQESCAENTIHLREENEKSPSKSPKSKPKKIPTKFQQNKLESVQKKS